MTLARLLRSAENPNLPLTSTVLAEWLTGSQSEAGVPVTEARVYGVPAYYRAVSILASMCAGLPLHTYRRGTRSRVAQRTVLDNPNPAQTPFEFWQTQYANAITWGNGYGRKIRNNADQVAEIWPIHPSKCRTVAVKVTKAVPDGKIHEVVDMDGTRRELTSWDVLQLPYMSLDGLAGVRPLQLFRQTLGIGLAAEQTSARFYRSGARLSGILTSKKGLTDESAKRLKARWRERTAGPENAGDIAVLDNDTTFQPLSIPPADAQLLESRRWTVSEVARMVGIPPHLLADVEKSTSWGTGIEQQQIALVVYTAKPWLQMVEQRTTRDLLPGGWSSGPWFAEYAIQGLMRGDAASRSAFYDSMRRNGAMSANDIRDLENLEPIEGGDEMLLPAGVLPAALAEQRSRIESLGALVRAGFDPAAAAEAMGLDPIKHTGLVPITVTPLEVTGGTNAPSPA